MSKKHGYGGVPRLVDIISAIPDEYKKALLPKLKARPIRTASGVRFSLQYHLLLRPSIVFRLGPCSCKRRVRKERKADYQSRFVQIAVVAVMCKPHRCPHIAMTGNICVYVNPSHLSVCPIHSVRVRVYSYCPGGPDSDFDYSTQSYTGYEPTSMRAIRARYDPYEQTRGRVEQLKALGHSVDKVSRFVRRRSSSSENRIQVEFIIMGGTFMSMPEEYRSNFVAQLHNALSGFTGTDVDEAVRYVALLSVKTVNSFLMYSYSDIRSKVNRRLSVSQSKPDRITASNLTSRKCSATDAHV